MNYMNEMSPQPVTKKGPWWFTWILCTVILPSGTFWISLLPSSYEWLWFVWVIVNLIFHLIASVKLGKGRSGWFIAGLIFGGWALMLVSVFIGCMALLIRSH